VTSQSHTLNSEISDITRKAMEKRLARRKKLRMLPKKQEKQSAKASRKMLKA
jgi:hypothetical protein